MSTFFDNAPVVKYADRQMNATETEYYGALLLSGAIKIVETGETYEMTHQEYAIYHGLSSDDKGEGLSGAKRPIGSPSVEQQDNVV